MAFGPPTRAVKSRPVTFIFDIPTTKTSRFWEELENGKVYGTKCKKCGHKYFPPAADCSECLTSDMEWIDLTGDEGEIETFTHVIVRPPSFADHETYTVAVAKMKQGVKVLAWLSGVKLGQAKVGMKVKLAGKPSPEGSSYELVPIQ
jgi:uncharacterized OB-fold protein